MIECYDCGLPYGEYEKWPLDFVIQDELWEKISPSGDQGGLLCPNCMCRRLRKLGMYAVVAVVDTHDVHKKFRLKNKLITKLVGLHFRVTYYWKLWSIYRHGYKFRELIKWAIKY